MKRAAILFLASGAYTGYAPVASGTVGTVVGIPLFWALAASGAPPAVHLVVVLLVTGFACWIAGLAEREIGEHDSGIIVIDEIAGYLAATLLLAPSWEVSAVAFVVFRLFDVVKPFPASYIDREISGGIGVVLDDVVSGVYANLATRVIFALIA